MNLNSFVGIDYGAVNSGNTVIAYFDGSYIDYYYSEKNNNADFFIIKQFEKHSTIKYAFIDAPLSLPKVYSKPQIGGDYFYREADKQLKAMSPMFIGGLTARAMKLKSYFVHKSIELIEVYPKALALELGLIEYKKVPFEVIINSIQSVINLKIKEPKTQHALDSLLAWFSGYRYLQNNAKKYGTPGEGVIIV